jgi:hypothetical protein
VGELPERGGKEDEESGREHEAVAIHRKVVMDTMKDEMEGDAYAIVGQVSVKKLAHSGPERNSNTYSSK